MSKNACVVVFAGKCSDQFVERIPAELEKLGFDGARQETASISHVRSESGTRVTVEHPSLPAVADGAEVPTLEPEAFAAAIKPKGRGK